MNLISAAVRNVFVRITSTLCNAFGQLLEMFHGYKKARPSSASLIEGCGRCLFCFCFVVFFWFFLVSFN